MQQKDIISESEKIELLSEDIQEIMGTVPRWIIRWGITVIMALVILLLLGSMIFQYPDVIISNATIISENPPVYILARSTGRISALYINNKQKVKLGQPLAIIENTASYMDILVLKKIIALFDSHPFTFDFFKNTIIPNNLILGNIQPNFSNFHRQFSEYINYQNINITDKKIKNLNEQIAFYELYYKRLQNQEINQKNILAICHKNYIRDSLSLSFGGLTASEFDKSEQYLLNEKNTYQILLSKLSNNLLQIKQLNYQIIELQNQNAEQTNKMISSLKEAYDNLKTSVLAWEQSYLITSHIDGIVTFTSFWSKNQQVTESEKIFTIIPEKPQKVFARAMVPIAGSGKIELGQKVRIKLENFPYMEYGMLEGKVESISMVPETIKSEIFYIVEISIPEGFKTSYKKYLPYGQNLQGTAEIITKKLTLFERVILPLKNAIYN